uniref:Uncharacterized protein n=1 Tax=Arundo donax TaxID=35708 RepID=A0A0A8ZV43_ARUDO
MKRMLERVDKWEEQDPSGGNSP